MEDFIFMEELESEIRDEQLFNEIEYTFSPTQLTEGEFYEFCNSFHKEVQ